ncbi:MAG: hypothetical protein EG824_00200 [Deltaproteobacteria bacterium]|nr:hypothetical protein [Deltaproteobacteria bacterium]
MKYAPGFWGSLLGGGSDWELKTGSSTAQGHLALAHSGKKYRVRLEDVLGVEVTPGLIWADITLHTAKKPLVISGVKNDVADQIETDIVDQVQEHLCGLLNQGAASVKEPERALKALLKQDRYLSDHDIRSFISGIGPIGAILGHPLFDADRLPKKTRQAMELLSDALSSERKGVRLRNAQFVEQELVREKEFFNSIETKPLTEEQQRAAIVLEDRNLVVAAAGSGKTSVIVAKIGYLLRKRLVKPEEILVLSFNKDAQLELETRIRKRLAPLLKGALPTIKTFHALGVEVLTEGEGKKPLIDKVATDGEAAFRRCIEELIAELAEKNPAFRKDWLQLAVLFAEPVKEPSDFKDRQEMEDWERQFRVFNDGQWGFMTLRGEMVKSGQERQIANWLALEGIRYEYERPYEHSTATRSHRQYLPDFYYPDAQVYHEHFALDRRGKAPSWFANGYESGVEWKRALHKRMGSCLIETTSAQFSDGTWMDHLDAELLRLSIPRKRLSADEQRALAKKSVSEQSNLVGLICAFLRHAKSMEASGAILKKKASDTAGIRAWVFIKVLLPVAKAYEGYLKGRGSIDFEDMITRSRAVIEAGQYRHAYKVILVDEFQDISQGRARLLRALLDQDPGCKLVAVGDDWQSIYRFAGSDIGIMNRFEEYFGKTEKLFLTRTFRCHSGITEASNRFIRKNPGQIAKEVSSENSSDDKTVRVLSAASQADAIPLVEATLDKLNQLGKRRKVRLSVFLLGRYWAVEPKKLSVWSQRYSELDIKFATIHASKGLEADYVLVLGLTNGRFGFPSAIADDPLLELVIPQPETFPYAEERRLFYVALTRARRCVFLVTVRGTESSFIREIVPLCQ